MSENRQTAPPPHLKGLIAISPSQIESFKGCQRKWSWDKLAGIKRITHPSAARGTHCHEMLEAYTAHNTPIDLSVTHVVDGKAFKPGPVIAQGLRYLTDIRITATEKAVYVPGVGSSPKYYFTGFTDFSFVRLGDDMHGVGDYKTTSNFQYAKTVEELKRDPQALIYAAARLAETSAEVVLCRWIYFRTTGTPSPAGAKIIEITLTRSDVEDGLRELDVIALQIVALREAGTTPETAKLFIINNVPPTPKACSDYGGCSYQEICNLSPRERMRAHMETPAKKLSLSERLRANATPLVPARPTEPAPAVPPALAPAVASKGINPPALPPRRTPTEEVIPAPPGHLEAPKALLQAPRRTPQEPTTLAPRPPVSQEAPKVLLQAPALTARRRVLPVDTAPRTDTAPTIFPVAPTLPAAREEMANFSAPMHDVPLAPGIVMTPAWATGITKPSAIHHIDVADVDSTKTLYINALPIMGDFHPTHFSVLDLGRVAALSNDVPHYRMIDFGKAPAALHIVTEAYLAEHNLSAIYVDTNTQEGQDALPALMRWAEIVIKGM